MDITDKTINKYEPMPGQIICDEILNSPCITLGSLFDGIGGFMVAAEAVDIKPLWASEIEPSCIAITKHHFPDVPHLGNIKDINGGEIPPTDIITFGSPCQDLSISGKRIGLSGERSGLYMEAIRIIKEMRATTNNRFPRYAIWENVPGALNSNEGNDFKIVLEELLNTVVSKEGGDEDSEIKRTTEIGFISVPKPPKWGNAGSIVGDYSGNQYSISWRILDAQYFGIPQRRKRIFVVADFRGCSSEEILFECESLSRHLGQGKEEKQNITITAGRSDKIANINNSGVNPVYRKSFSIVENVIDRGIKNGGNGKGVNEDISYTLTSASPHAVVNCSIYNKTGFSSYKENEIASTLMAHLEKQVADLIVNLGSQGDRIYCNAKKSCSLTAHGGGGGAQTGMYFFDEAYENGIKILGNALQTENLLETLKHIINKEGIENLLQQGYELHINGVRRLTPLECERLQGYTDGWTNLEVNGKPISDRARYKALGNSICVNVVVFLLERIKAYMTKEREERMVYGISVQPK